MSDHRASPLATAFLWTVGVAATVGLGGAITHLDRGRIEADMGTAAGVAGVVAYVERKKALSPG